jgi:hypothetical protein
MQALHMLGAGLCVVAPVIADDNTSTELLRMPLLMPPL